MSKAKNKRLEEAKQILKAFDLPRKQTGDPAGYALLALAGIKADTPWSDADQAHRTIHELMAFMREHHGKHYAENSRENVRKDRIHPFLLACIAAKNVDDQSKATNHGGTNYSLTDEALRVVRSFDDPLLFQSEMQDFLKTQGSLRERFAKRRELELVPVKLPDGSTLKLSPGRHNELQAAVVEKLAPHFAPGATLLYLGDTESKHVVFEEERLAKLGFTITKHDKLPDVVMYVEEKNWLFFIEAAVTHGPVDHKRYLQLEELLENCSADPVFITAFPDSATFRKYAADIAWETEVWIADQPGHMIHFNGPKFVGPY